MTQKETKKSLDIFGKSNYIWMLVGALLITAGMLLMTGGKSADPNVFNASDCLKKPNKYKIYSDPDACARDLFFNTPL